MQYKTIYFCSELENIYIRKKNHTFFFWYSYHYFNIVTNYLHNVLQNLKDDRKSLFRHVVFNKKWPFPAYLMSNFPFYFNLIFPLLTSPSVINATLDYIQRSKNESVLFWTFSSAKITAFTANNLIWHIENICALTNH